MDRQRGFSLFELVMVVVILAIIAVAAVPKLTTLGGFTLNNAAHDLLSAIRHAQHRSMTLSGADPFQVSVLNGFTVTQNGTDITHPLTGAAAYTEQSDAWNGVTVNAGTIQFDSRGRPHCSNGLSACTLPTDSNAVFTLSMNGQSLTLTVERYTGYAHID